MFSTETPPCSSCPCNSSALSSPHHLASEVAEKKFPSFSIRDYVFTSRSKDIATNWPFPQEFLQVCVKHGVRNLLPSFEPPDSLRTRCRKAIESEQPVDCLEAPAISTQLESLDTKDICLVDEEPCNINESCLRSDDLALGCSKQEFYPVLEKHEQVVDCGNISYNETGKNNAEPISVVTLNLSSFAAIPTEGISNHTSEVPCTLQATISGSVSSTEVETAQLDSSPSELEKLRQPSQNKCRLIVKLSAIAETKCAEDTDSTSSTVADPMASQVCPVCKLFASSSNTTLNAHIDQCLSADSNIQQAVVETPKFKVKPTKKRLMVDIYVTAPRSTLEDIDRRNGTNWTSGLSSNPPFTVVPTENKRPEIAPLDTREDELEADARNDVNEGAVYVDSNGIKLRILSKFNDTPPVMPVEPFKSDEHAENIMAGKSLLLSKKSHFTSKSSKSMKVKPQLRRLSSFELFKGEIQAIPEGDQNVVPLQERKCSPSEMLNAPHQIRNSSSSAIRRWICSKCSDHQKKFNNKGHSLEKSVYRKRSRSPESNQLDVRNSSVVKSHVLKFSRTEENLTSSVKTRRVNFLSNTGKCMDNEKCPKMPLSGLLESASMPATEVITNQSPSGSDISESDEGEYASMMEKHKRLSLKWLHLDAECSDLDMATSNAHVDSSKHVATVSNSSMETASDDPTIGDAVIQTDCALPSISKIDLRPLADEHMQHLHVIDAECMEKSTDEQELQNCNPIHDEVFNESIKMAYETWSGYNLGRCTDQYSTECQARTGSAQISSACLTNHSDSMHEISSKVLESAVKAPNSVDISSPSPSPGARTNSILRLMGKDLMVANNGEQLELPKTPHSSPDDANARRSLPTIFGATGLESFYYNHHRFPGSSAVFGLDPSMVHQQLPLHSPTIQVGGYAGPVQAGLKMEPDQHTPHNWNKMSSSPPVCHVGRMAASHPCHQKPIASFREKLLKEVIVIDDSPELESAAASSVDVMPDIPGSDTTRKRPLSFLESQSQLLSRGVPSCFRPCPTVCPRYYTNNILRRKMSEAPDHLVPRPVVFQSPTNQLRPPLYYSQML